MPMAEIHLLDPGAVNYGDSILCHIDSKWILIDGARTRSAEASSSSILGATVNHPPLQQQIEDKTGGMHVDLVVITHCHSDHVGCLPKLIADHGLTFDWALVADPQLGFGLGITEIPPEPDAMPDAWKLRFALREESPGNVTDQELTQFILDSASEYKAYKDLLKGIKDRIGDRMVVYKGLAGSQSPGLAALLTAFASTNLSVLGPTQEQLLLCSAALEGRSSDADDPIAAALRDSPTLASAYRKLISRQPDAAAADGDNGNAVNCQSIVLTLGAGDKKFLLSGDMQFAQASLGPDMKEEMNRLCATVAANGPYHFVKLPHHGAANGLNESLLRAWGAKFLAISTGSRSGQHPSPVTLEVLRRLRPEGFRWVRTDMNGLCTFTLNDTGAGSLRKTYGDWNDTTEPTSRDGDSQVRIAAPAPGPVLAPTVSSTDTQGAGGTVEVTIRIPNQKTRVSLTIEIDPGSGRKVPEDPPRPFA